METAPEPTSSATTSTTPTVSSTTFDPISEYAVKEILTAPVAQKQTATWKPLIALPTSLGDYVVKGPYPYSWNVCVKLARCMVTQDFIAHFLPESALKSKVYQDTSNGLNQLYFYIERVGKLPAFTTENPAPLPQKAAISKTEPERVILSRAQRGLSTVLECLPSPKAKKEKVEKVHQFMTPDEFRQTLFISSIKLLILRFILKIADNHFGNLLYDLDTKRIVSVDMEESLNMDTNTLERELFLAPTSQHRPSLIRALFRKPPSKEVCSVFDAWLSSKTTRRTLSEFVLQIKDFLTNKTDELDAIEKKHGESYRIDIAFATKAIDYLLTTLDPSNIWQSFQPIVRKRKNKEEEVGQDDDGREGGGEEDGGNKKKRKKKKKDGQEESTTAGIEVDPYQNDIRPYLKMVKSRIAIASKDMGVEKKKKMKTYLVKEEPKTRAKINASRKRRQKQEQEEEEVHDVLLVDEDDDGDEEDDDDEDEDDGGDIIVSDEEEEEGEGEEGDSDN